MSVPVLFLAAALATAGAPQQPASPPPRPSSNAPDDRLATLAPPVPCRGRRLRPTARISNGRLADIGERTGLNEPLRHHRREGAQGQGASRRRRPAGPAMYGIDGLTDEQLTLHVGRRVHIDGTLRQPRSRRDASRSEGRASPGADGDDDPPGARATARSRRAEAARAFRGRRAGPAQITSRAAAWPLSTAPFMNPCQRSLVCSPANSTRPWAADRSRRSRGSKAGPKTA